MAVGVDMGMVSFFMVLLSGLGTSLTAVPPGERDASYLQCAPADTLVYVEWSSRGTGTPGADGIDGLVADPEFVSFISTVKSAVLAAIEKNAPRSAEPVMKHAVPLAFDLINRSGCLYINYVPPDGDAEPIADLDWMKAAQQATVTIIIDGGDQADETEQHILALLAQIPGGPGGGTGEPGAAAKKLDHYEISLPLPEMKVVLHREGTHFIAALGAGALDRAIAGLKGEVDGLGKAEIYQANLKLIDMERVGTVTWLNLGRLRDEALKLAGPYGTIAGVMMTQLGIDQVNSCLSVTGVIDGQIASRTYVGTGSGQNGLLTLISGRGLTSENLKSYPEDCDFLMSFTLDLPLIHTTIKSLIQDIEPGLAENFEAIESQLADELGFSIEEDVLDAFGQQITMFDSPSAGGLLFSSVMAAFEVKDAEKAEKVFGQLMQMLKASLPGDRSTEYARRGVFLEEREFMNQTFYFVNTIGDDDVPVAPTFCLTEKALFVSLHPQSLKAHLRFLAEEGPSYADRFPEDELPKGTVISYGSFSTDKLMDFIYAAVPYVAQIALSGAQKNGVEIDISSVPSARAILPYLKESRGWVVRTENGILFESRNSLPAGMLTSVPLNLLMVIPTRVRIQNRAVPVPGGADF